LMLKVVAVPVEGVNVMAVGTTLKLTSPRLAGGVPATRTKLTLAVPPPSPLPLGRLWHPERSTAVAKVAERKDLVCFIEYPTWMNVRSPSRVNCLESNPKLGFYAEE
jgi:hypothetical protein